MKQHTKSIAARVLGLVLCAVMALSLVPAARAAQLQPTVSKNLDAYVCGNWASPINSYLFENSIGGLTRVEYIYDYSTSTAKIVVEDYDSLFRLQASRQIQPELSLWGGFYAGKDYNFFIFGQRNPTESDNVEVVRVVKYDKNWNRLGQASLYGANTTVPFNASALRCAEGGGWLYVRTAHQMYTSQKDGKNHQASLMIALRQSDMTMMDSSVMSIPDVGYVSHSFNQFILVDQQDRIVYLDHGDGYPRALLLQREETKAGADRFGWWNEQAKLVEFPGGIGINATGCSVGGFAETTNGYVAAYSYDGKGAGYARDLYVAFIEDDLSFKTTRITSGVYSFTPVMASTGLDGGYVMWQNPTRSNEPLSKTLKYIRYDANGNVGDTQTTVGALSDCAPIYWNGKLVWYVTNDSVPVFYTLDSSGVMPFVATAGSGTPAPAPANTAYANTQTVLLNGKSVEFQTYALKDSKGNLTNYIKLRDLAYYLNGTRAQFSIEVKSGVIYLATGQPYAPNGSELSTPFSGSRTYKTGTGKTMVDSVSTDMSSIILTDDKGGDYTYYQLRDMGRRLGFNVSYINGQVVINTSEPYSDDQ